MKKRRFADGGETVEMGPNPNIDDDTRERARKFVEDNDSTINASGEAFKKALAKPKVVTKEELAKSGLSLRDYMNKQQGLTRRGGAAPDAYSKEQQYQRAQEAAQTPEGKAQRRAMEQSQALEGSYPVESVAGGAAGLLRAGLGKLVGRGAAKEAARAEPYLAREMEQAALPAPAKQLALPSPTKRIGYDKAGAKATERGARSEGRQAEMLKENARRSGLREDAPEATTRAVREKLGGNDFSLPMKKGGAVKKYAAGGSVSSRADGIAQRGKTRGKMC
jgi:hypothetical protein